VENRRVGGGRVVHAAAAVPWGEINDSQELAWRKSIAVLEEGAAAPAPPCRCSRKTAARWVLPDAAVVRLKLAEPAVVPAAARGGGCWRR